VGHFKRYFKYTLYIIIGMNNVMSSSKDWSFNQIVADVWCFFEHISMTPTASIYSITVTARGSPSGTASTARRI
ncbi:MAG: hypothetical protein IKH27_12790, partial [Oscillospiraceae bacterium]|nr:hypothetical protein [Oscillospiraceae bacterium]